MTDKIVNIIEFRKRRDEANAVADFKAGRGRKSKMPFDRDIDKAAEFFSNGDYFFENALMKSIDRYSELVMGMQEFCDTRLVITKTAEDTVIDFRIDPLDFTAEKDESQSLCKVTIKKDLRDEVRQKLPFVMQAKSALYEQDTNIPFAAFVNAQLDEEEYATFILLPLMFIQELQSEGFFSWKIDVNGEANIVTGELVSVTDQATLDIEVYLKALRDYYHDRV